METDHQTSLQHALGLHRLGHLTDAELIYAEISRRAPQLPIAHLRADIALQQGLPDRAVSLLEAAAAAQPNMRLVLARALLASGQPDRAKTVLTGIHGQNSRAEVTAALSVAHELAGETIRAEMLRRSLGLTLPVLHRARGVEAAQVVLTIDDGPTPECTPRLLEILEREGAHATFFVVGERAERTPDLLARIHHDGHDLLNHGYSHTAFTRLTAPEIEIGQCERVLAKIRPTPGPYPIRLPFGQGWDCPRLHASLASARPDGALIQWSLAFQDWTIAPRCRTSADIRAVCRQVVFGALAQAPASGSILLCHDLPIDATSPLAAETACVMLQEILARLRQLGVKATSLSRCTEAA